MSKKKLQFNLGKAIMFSAMGFVFSLGHLAKASAKGDPNYGGLILILAVVFVAGGYLDSLAGD